MYIHVYLSYHKQRYICYSTTDLGIDIKTCTYFIRSCTVIAACTQLHVYSSVRIGLHTCGVHTSSSSKPPLLCGILCGLPIWASRVQRSVSWADAAKVMARYQRERREGPARRLKTLRVYRLLAPHGHSFANVSQTCPGHISIRHCLHLHDKNLRVDMSHINKLLEEGAKSDHMTIIYRHVQVRLLLVSMTTECSRCCMLCLPVQYT